MKKYVIIKIGKRYSLKEKFGKGFFGAGLFVNTDLQKVKDFAKDNNMEIIAIGDIWEV